METVNDNVDKCVLCEDDLSAAPNTTVRKKGLERFIACSRACGDGFAERWVSLDSDICHEKCRLRYIKIKRDGNEVKRKLRGTEYINDTNELPSFNFNEYCFVCAERCSQKHERKKSREKRKRIRKVCEKTQLEEKVRAAAMKIDDAKGKSVLNRLKENINLAEEGAVYHLNCLTLFLRRTPKVNQHFGRPINVEWTRKFERVCRRIDNSGKQQFLVEELLNDMGDNPPSMNHFKTMLVKRYGDNILFSSGGSKKLIITFRGEADRILLNHFAAEILNSTKKNGLTKDSQPDELLGQISCNCSTNCTTCACTCRRLGLQCTFLCKSCYHANCENAASAYILEDEAVGTENDGRLNGVI